MATVDGVVELAVDPATEAEEDPASRRPLHRCHFNVSNLDEFLASPYVLPTDLISNTDS
jgi:hypothetical protein